MSGGAGHLRRLQMRHSQGVGRINSGWPRPAWPSTTWWRGLGSAELNPLIGTARGDSFARRGRGACPPSGCVCASGGREFAAVDFSRWIGDASIGRSSGTSAHETDFSAELAASCELDFWGKTKTPAMRRVRFAGAALHNNDCGSGGHLFYATFALQTFNHHTRRSPVVARYVKLIERRVRVGVTAPADLAAQVETVSAEDALVPQRHRSLPCS
jgi:hypothetical protein